MTVLEESTAREHKVDLRIHKANKHELRSNKGGGFRRPTGEYYPSTEDPYAFAAASPLANSAYYTMHTETRVLPPED